MRLLRVAHYLIVAALVVFFGQFLIRDLLESGAERPMLTLFFSMMTLLFAGIGIAAGADFDASTLDADRQAALAAAIHALAGRDVAAMGAAARASAEGAQARKIAGWRRLLGELAA